MRIWMGIVALTTSLAALCSLPSNGQGVITNRGAAVNSVPAVVPDSAPVLTPREVASRLAARGVNTWNGDNYAYELCGALGLEPDGAVRAGLVHYNDASDVDRLLAGVGELAS